MTESRPGDDARIVVTVVRTGGIAGLRRHWQVEPPVDENPRWVTLIEQCPWDAACEVLPGADRYVWRIRAHTAADRRQRDIPDGALAGPWRELVDAVRGAEQPEKPARPEN